MTTPQLRLRGPQTARLTPAFQKPLGQILVDDGVLTPEALMNALGLAETLSAPLRNVLVSEGWASADDILQADAKRFGAIPITLETTPPDVECNDLLDPAFCLKHQVWPWIRLGETVVIATSNPDRFAQVQKALPSELGETIMGVAKAQDIETAIGRAHGARMAALSEVDIPAEDSCRSLHVLATHRQMTVALLGAAIIGAGLLWVPDIFFLTLGAWLLMTLVATAGMRVGALCARMSRASVTPVSGDVEAPLPNISLLVPLFQETDIAGALVARLNRLTYPKTKLEALLVLEAEDKQTRSTLAQTDLPPWMRVITVPPGSLTTKPRAMNYARRFATGDIIGIYDAEDSPAPNQLETVVHHFQRAPPDVACLQGILDYYNPKMNWLSRCFTIEYAAWFRILLPGLARLGFPIPLGGTTVFLRRDVLDALGGWDAHNVTEDADLGIRLARAGYKTQLVDTVTLEEANCRFWPWIRQRSRWLKGYYLTYRSHMRRPGRLLKDLGWGGFLGFQIFFLGAISQFALAPLMWSFWLAFFGLAHPIVDALPRGWFGPLVSVFLLCEAIGLLIGMTAVASPRHRHLIPWVPTLTFYFPMGAIAFYKGVWQSLSKPFFWDKTTHGLSLGRGIQDHETD